MWRNPAGLRFLAIQEEIESRKRNLRGGAVSVWCTGLRVRRI